MVIAGLIGRLGLGVLRHVLATPWAGSRCRRVLNGWRFAPRRLPVSRLIEYGQAGGELQPILIAGPDDQLLRWVGAQALGEADGDLVRLVRPLEQSSPGPAEAGSSSRGARPGDPPGRPCGSRHRERADRPAAASCPRRAPRPPSTARRADRTAAVCPAVGAPARRPCAPPRWRRVSSAGAATPAQPGDRSRPGS
jgi:hypothetical protein